MRRPRRRARPRVDAHLAIEGRQRRRHPDVRCPLSRVDGYITRLSGKAFAWRSAIRSKTRARPGASSAGSRSRRLSGNPDRRRLPRRARAGVSDGGVSRCGAARFRGAIAEQIAFARAMVVRRSSNASGSFTWRRNRPRSTRRRPSVWRCSISRPANSRRGYTGATGCSARRRARSTKAARNHRARRPERRRRRPVPRLPRPACRSRRSRVGVRGDRAADAVDRCAPGAWRAWLRSPSRAVPAPAPWCHHLRRREGRSLVHRSRPARADALADSMPSVGAPRRCRASVGRPDGSLRRSTLLVVRR